MTTKVCKDCREVKPLGQFYSHVHANGRKYYSSYCKPCMVARNRATDRQRRDKNFLRLWRYLAEHPCVDCGEDNPLKLSLDHRGEDKTGDVANLMKHSWQRIKAELALCDVRCHNCHAVKTHASLGHFVTKSLRDYVTKWPENKKAYQRYAK